MKREQERLGLEAEEGPNASDGQELQKRLES